MEYGIKTKRLLGQLSEKTIDRYNDILKLHHLSIDKIIGDIQLHFVEDNELQLIHGDFCFSNLMYNFRSNRVVLLDPRGCDFSGTYTQYGPRSYDIAKLGHSIIGRYDEIVYDMYEVNKNGDLIFFENNNYLYVKKLFLEQMRQKEISLKSLYAEIICLFLTMLPLHSDSPQRQYAFFINSIRLFKEYSKL